MAVATYHLIYTSEHQSICIGEFPKVILVVLFVIKTDMIRICTMVDDSLWQSNCTHNDLEGLQWI